MNVKNKKFSRTRTAGLTWREMQDKMNQDKLHKDPSRPLKQPARAQDEFLSIMEKLSQAVWQFYHPEGNPNAIENKKRIKQIAKSDYFSELVENALCMKDKDITE
jgi:hypothetical protein